MEVTDDRKILRYSTAAAICLAAVAVQILLTPLVGPRSPLIAYYPAIAFATLLCGAGPGVFATIFACLLAVLMQARPPYAGLYPWSVIVIQSSVFLTVGLLTAWVASGRFPIRPFIEGPIGNPEQRAKKSEEALEYHKGLMQAAQRISGFGIWEWDFRTNEITWSEGIYQLLRIPPGRESAEEIWKRVVDERDLKASTLAITRAIAEKRREHYFELGITRGDGSRCHLMTRGEIYYDQAGNALKILGVNIDISERKEAELKIASLNRELARRIDELQAIYDIAPVGIAFATDPTCDVVTANPALAVMLGVAPGTNISKNATNTEKLGFRHVRGDEELPVWELPSRRAIAEKRNIFDEEVEIERADGKRLTLLCSAAPIFDETGNVISCVSAQIDITEQKSVIGRLEQGIESERHLRADAENLSRIKDEFLASVSHELRTPLNSIIGWASLLTAAGVTDEVRAKGLRSIELSASAQSMMIDDLLDLSRMIAGKLRIGKYHLDLIPLVTASVDTLRPAALDKEIDLTVSIDPETGKISGDAERVQQIVWNLLSNAIKFTPEKGRISVDLRTCGSFAELSVRDTGCGIKPEFLEHVFDRFTQQDGSLTRRFNGLGLGLAITKKLVELHGGTIVAESPGVDLGSAFIVRIPLVPEAISGITSGRLPKLGKDTGRLVGNELHGAQILVVDDDPDSREVVKIFLEQYGSVVDTAESAFAAFEKFTMNGYRMVISDIGMPEEDGYQLIGRIRAFEGTSGRVPAIALTAYARTEDKTRALEAGFDEHVAKPVEPETLVAAACRLLRVR